jgi:tetratricopeptide (TPR) repeat protein
VVAGLARAHDKSAYEAELQRTDNDIRDLQASLRNVPGDLEKRTKLAYRLYHRASLSGIEQAFKAAETEVVETIRQFGPQEDLCLLRANLHFRFHRLAEVKQDLDLAPALRTRAEGLAIQADLEFQEGHYEQARVSYDLLVSEHRTWDNLARLAYFKGKMGSVASADQLYQEAEDELTAKEMRSYAWLELQRGLLCLTRGLNQDAGAHYKRADLAYTGFWQIQEHIAELMAARGEFGEAVALYESVLERAPRPDLQQTLGELHLYMGQPDRAKPWLDAALAAYLESAGRGEVHYYHHLADFFADVRVAGAEAVKWARKDLELRENFSTQGALAWALYRDGRIDEALDFSSRAVSSGVVDAELSWQAGEILKAAGRSVEAENHLAAAARINPHFESFHVHR